MPFRAGKLITSALKRCSSAQAESASRGGQAICRTGTIVGANPIHRTGILPKLLREDFWRRIRSVVAPHT